MSARASSPAAAASRLRSRSRSAKKKKLASSSEVTDTQSPVASPTASTRKARRVASPTGKAPAPAAISVAGMSSVAAHTEEVELIGVNDFDASTRKAQAKVRRASIQHAPFFWRAVLWINSVWFSYLHALQHSPVITKSLTAAGLSVLSDLLSQWLGGTIMSGGKSFLDSVDWVSIRNQAIIGFFIRGLPIHYWYTFLVWLFRDYDGSHPQRTMKHPTSPSSPQYVAVDQAERGARGAHEHGTEAAKVEPAQSPFWVIVAKVLVDQLTYGPFSNWLYFYVIGAFEGRTLAYTTEKVAREFLPLLIDNWKVWPLVTLANFKFVPPALQVLFGNIVSVFWTVYVISITR